MGAFLFLYRLCVHTEHGTKTPWSRAGAPFGVWKLRLFLENLRVSASVARAS